MRRYRKLFVLLEACLVFLLAARVECFCPPATSVDGGGSLDRTRLHLAQISQQEAQKGIDKVVNALRKDSSAQKELGRLDKVTAVLGYGSNGGSMALRFNASFKKAGKGLSSVPLPFGLGQSNESEGRGQMVGQVKASVDEKTGKVTSCSVFRDLGYGRAFNLKV